MKASSGTLAVARIIFCVFALLAAAGYYGHVRAQNAPTSATVVIPLRPLAPLSSVPIPPVFGLEGIVANKNAAAQLGKALFWDMQAGSDDLQACASCHFNAGADSRGERIDGARGFGVAARLLPAADEIGEHRHLVVRGHPF